MGEPAESEMHIPTTSTTTNLKPPLHPFMFTIPRVNPLSGDRRSISPSSSSTKCFPLCNPTNVPFIKKIVAEYVGTFILLFSAAATPIVNDKYSGAATLIGAAASAGLAVTVIILTIGHISGAHLNPAVTLAFAVCRHFPWAEVPGYVFAQILGSISASFALKFIFHPFHSGGVTVPTIGTAQAFFLEFILTFGLMFVITAIATDHKAVREFAGVAIGATVLMNILVGGKSTGGSMNPVRTLGPAIAASNYDKIWIYMIAPVLGAISGAFMYTALKL